MKDRIRQATSADAVAIHNLHTRSVRGLCAADYPDEVIEGWLKGRSPEGYKGIAKNEMYVYEKNGEIVGWSHVRPKAIVGLFVDAEHAGKGIGRALFEHGLHIIRQNTREHLEFEATVTAAPFYEKCGCKRLSTSTVRKNDIDVPTVRMALPEKSEQDASSYGSQARRT
jgi:putative acetyltransferase